MLIISFLVSVYYNTIIAWVLYYLFESFRADVPWRDCNNKWNTADCFEAPPSEKVIDPINVTINGVMTLGCPKLFVKSFEGVINDTLLNSTVFDTCTYVKPKIQVLPAEEFLK